MTREREKEAFLNTIIETPDDDTARLVYADWLDENGEPERAEFIRAEIPGATAESGTGRRGLARDLKEQHGKKWAAEARCNVRGVARVGFRHGFIEEVHASADAFVLHGATWASRTPVRALTLSGVAGRCAAVAGCPHLRRIANLTVLDPQLGDADLRALAASTHLTRLRTLRLGGRTRAGYGREAVPVVGTDGLLTMAGAPLLGGLTQLQIWTRADYGADALEAFLGAAGLTLIEDLFLGGGGVGDGGATAIAGCSRLGNLRHLGLTVNGVGSDGMLALLGSPALRKVTHINLFNNEISAHGLAGLATTDIPPDLIAIVLAANPLGAMDVAPVVRLLKDRPDLHLDLRRCRLPAPQRRALRDAGSYRVQVDPLPERRRGPIVD